MNKLRPIPRDRLKADEPAGFNVFIYLHQPETMLHLRRIGELLTLFDVEMLSRFPADDVLGLPSEFAAEQESRSIIQEIPREEDSRQINTYVERTGEVALSVQPIGSEMIHVLISRVAPIMQNLRGLLQKLSFTPVAAFEQAFLLYQDSDALVAHLQRTAAFSILSGAFVGLTNPADYGELAQAAILHDIGLSRMPRTLILKHIQGRDDEVTEGEPLYHEHPRRTLEAIQAAGLSVSVNIARTIEHHHETFDGSGPLKKMAGGIFRMGHILRINDELVTRMSRVGNPVDFKTALSQISAAKGANGLAQFDPELIQRLSILLKR